jgi:hypothetical protein
MTIRRSDEFGHARQSKWEIIGYAIESTPRTIRLCVILLAASIPPGLITLIFHH